MRAIELYRTEPGTTKADFLRAHPAPFVIYAKNTTRENKPNDMAALTIDRFVVDGNRPATLAETMMAAALQPTDPSENVVTIGAGPGCDLVVNDNSLSKQHAWFARATDGWQIWDNDSVGGTQVNNELLKPGFPRTLASGDIVTLGYVDVTFLLPEAFYTLVKHIVG